MATFPIVQFREYSINQDPSGFTDQNSNGFRGVRSTIAGETLVFSPLDVTFSGGITETHLLLTRATSMGDASGIYDMRFFLSSTSAWTQGTFRFLEFKNRHFIINRVMSEADPDTPTTPPATTNLVNRYGGGFLSGITEDNVSQYIYLGVLARPDVNIGLKGGAGLNQFRYRMLYNFS